MPKKLNILLSAYACEPNRGSEPGVGWNWAIEIAKRGHHVVVLTRKNNQPVIEKASYDKQNIQFVYYDLPQFILRFKKYLGVNLYYSLWQFFVAFKAKRIDDKINFDCVHHITFGVFRQISFIPFLIKKKFIFGPVGGGEYTPSKLKDVYQSKYKIREFLRLIANKIALYSPLYRLFIKRVTFFVAKTPETAEYLPPKHKNKLLISLEIGVQPEVFNDEILATRHPKTILFVGRFIYWKGIKLVLETFLRLNKDNSEYELILIGKGEELGMIKTFMNNNSLSNYKIINWLPQHELSAYYAKSSLMLFPSHHDSSGNVVLEALSFGLPVISLDVGGPAQVIGEMNTIVKHNNDNTQELADRLAIKINEIMSNPQLYSELCQTSILRAKELTWEKSVNKIYSIIEKSNNNIA